MLFEENSGLVSDKYNCGDGDYQYSYNEATEKNRLDFIQLLQDQGYCSVSSNSIGENTFDTYYKSENDGWHICYYPTESLLKVISVNGKAADIEAETACATPALAQLGLAGADLSADSNGAPGMSYVLTLADGRYVIIDGGLNNSDDKESLLAYLEDNNERSGEPVIAAWFFTHAHPDHMALANAFIAEYHDSFVLQAVYANFPDFDSLTLTRGGDSECSSMKSYVVNLRQQLATYFPNAAEYRYHTGEKLNIAGAEFEILYTHEDYFPTVFQWGNDTSSAFRINIEGTTILFLGDCDVRANAFIASVYGDELKCDIVQITHHGFNGGTAELYGYCNPTVCLWPVDQTRFYNYAYCTGEQSGYEFYATLRSSVSYHYHTSETTVISLPLNVASLQTSH